MSAGFADLLAVQGVWLGGRRVVSRGGGSSRRTTAPPVRRRYDVEALILVLMADDARRFTPLL